MDKPEDGVKEEDVKLPEESPTPEETTEEVEEPKAEVATPEEEPKTETESESTGKGANQRIRELNQRTKVAEERAKSLSDRLAEITSPVGLPQEQTPAYKPQVEPGQEITQEQYQADLDRVSDAKIELKLKQNDAVNRHKSEGIESVRKYPQLDPESDTFDKELSDVITDAVEAHVRVNPYSASVTKLVDRLMKPYLGSVAKEVGKVSEKLTKQVSETALRPTSVRKGEKDASEKSIAELEAELGVVQA